MDHIVVSAPDVSPYLTVAFEDGDSPAVHFVRRAEAIRRHLDQPCGVTVLASSSEALGELVPPDWSVVVPPSQDRSARVALSALDEKLSPDIERIVWLDLDAPFVSASLGLFLAKLHRDTHCDYTFGDGFPIGYAAQIVSRSVVPALTLLGTGREIAWTRSMLFDLLSVDINAFDVETEASSEDYALLRVSLTVDSRANYALCRTLAGRGLADNNDPAVPDDPMRERFPDDTDPLLQTILADGTVRRTLPYYYVVQVTNAMSQTPVYYPWANDPYRPPEPATSGAITVADFLALIERIAEFTPEATVSFGYRGEFGLHPHAVALVESLGRFPSLDFIIETSGVGWEQTAIDSLCNASANVTVIVELDAIEPEKYLALRGDGFDEAVSFIERLRGPVAGRLYVQATRSTQNEWDLPAFYKHWRDTEGVKPLIQKYNSFAGRLADLRPADLTPVHRIPCWHVQREMTILYDGSVIRCHQDLDGDRVYGNANQTSLGDLWERAEAEYHLQLTADYPALCETCDEYYTFNG